jgi:NADH:ubiquinone oxidoreductase subunit K
MSPLLLQETINTGVDLQQYVVLSGILFSIGVYGVLARRNAVLILMSVELMLNAVSINMVAFAVYTAPSLFVGIIFTIFIITIAAAEVGLALGIVLRVFRNRGTANVDEIDSLKW